MQRYPSIKILLRSTSKKPVRTSSYTNHMFEWSRLHKGSFWKFVINHITITLKQPSRCIVGKQGHMLNKQNDSRELWVLFWKSDLRFWRIFFLIYFVQLWKIVAVRIRWNRNDFKLPLFLKASDYKDWVFDTEKTKPGWSITLGGLKEQMGLAILKASTDLLWETSQPTYSLWLF